MLKPQFARFNPEDQKHVSELKMMLDTQSMPNRVMDELPKYSVLIYLDEKPTAFGGIRMIEGNYGLFDSYLTNKNESPENRDQALTILTVLLTARALEFGLKAVFSMSSNKSILNRARSHGFKDTDQKIQVLKL